LNGLGRREHLARVADDRVNGRGRALLQSLNAVGEQRQTLARLPGSLGGSLIGITAAVLMLVALSYVLLKRVPALYARATKYVAPRTLLAIHVYAGVAGPLLGLIHAAHKFDSPIGISLTGTMVLVVLSGYVGRYFLGQIARAVRGRKSELAALRGAYAALPPAESEPSPPGRSTGRWYRALIVPEEAAPAAGRDGADAAELASAIADTEYAIRSEEVVNSLLRRWLTLHIILAIVLVLLLTLHIWSGLYYGLRWL
jgi:hypothetical protein